ncbi:unnamed protein product [Paramecium sonneborni]|uniref:Uncharacterized protein n=1 Tax=Paramecium sonneborni TaxID=65129 RepID=A0A8S1JYL5_9CILI|nr:unnamed protein product [Paramecium sonneborni]
MNAIVKIVYYYGPTQNVKKEFEDKHAKNQYVFFRLMYAAYL